MKAVIFAGIDALEVVDRPEPALPSGGVIVETAFVGVCGSDVRTWHHGSSRLAGAQVLGHEVSGTIVRSDVVALPIGTRVAVCPGAPCLACYFCQRGKHNLCRNRIVLGYDFPGGMEERFAVPFESVRAGCVVPIDDSLPLRHAVLSEPLHTVINGQNQARIGADDTVLVIGLGTIGTLHTALARSRGASRVLAVDLREERVATATRVLGEGIAEQLGSDEDALRARGGQYGWDVVILAAGVTPAVDLAMSVVSPAGRILAFAGFPPSKPTVGIDLNVLHYRQIELIGSFAGTPTTFAQAADWLARTTIDLDAFVGDVFSLEDPTAAFANVEAGHGLKTVMQGT